MSYTNTFILVADDCPATSGIVPVAKGKHTPIHVWQYELLSERPYTYSHEDLIFAVHIKRSGISEQELTERKAEIWSELFRKGHPCLRASALTKRYGWGAHYDEAGKIALCGMETEAYQAFAQPENDSVKVLMAMRSKRRK